MSFELSVIKGQTIHAIIDGQVPRCIEVVRDAYLAHGEGRTVNPPSHFLRFPDKPNSRIIALPASLGAEAGVSGIKWIASYPDNIRQGFPRASAVLILNDYQTGYPFAILESSIISAARTAASAALAAERIQGGERRTGTLGIVGNGLIARYVYRYLLAAGWAIDHVVLFDLDPAEARRFAQETVQAGAHTSVSVAPDLPALLQQSSLLVLTTTAGRPHITDPAHFSHNPVVLHLSLRDLSPAIIAASHNLVDDVDHSMKADTSLHLLEQDVGHRRFVTGTIADLMTGRCAIDRTRPVIFSPFGVGILDLAVGKWVYDEAVAAGLDLRLPDFFYELTR